MPHERHHAPFPHPAHRTGRADFPHPALGEGLTRSPTGGWRSAWVGSPTIPSLWRATPSATSERSEEVLGSSPLSWSLVASCVHLQLRPLPSASVTRLHRYYGPLRHPTRPGLSLAGFRLRVTRPRRWGFPCCVSSPLTCMPSPLPRQDPQCVSLVLPQAAYHSGRRPSLDSRRVGSCIKRFGACSAFTHITACTLAKSPQRPSAPRASAASLPPLLPQLLPGGAIQFPGGNYTR